MQNLERKKHWENVYQTKNLKDTSWFQPNPETSISFLEKLKISPNAKIIDIGGGDSFLVDHLIHLGFKDITVLDISEAAITKAKQRLGTKSKDINWVVSDISDFIPTEKYDFWHDRAAFHFLTEDQEITNYLETAEKNINPYGFLVIGTFSEQGPKKCSGIEIKQYSENSMTEKLQHYFNKIECITVDHITPFDTVQNFVFCSFRKDQN